MKLGGTLVYNGIKYFVAMEETRGKVAWHIISELHQQDIRTRFSGERPQHLVMDLNWLSNNVAPEDYIIEAVSRNKLGDSSFVFKAKNIIGEVITSINSASAYRFAESDIKENIAETTMGETWRRFNAKDDRMEFRFTKQDNQWRELYLNYGQIEILLSISIKIKTPKKLAMLEVKDKHTAAKVVESVSSVDYQTLRQHPNLDLSWYEPQPGVFAKDYIAIETVEEFEKLIIEDLVYHTNLCTSRGEKLLLSLDTETTGLVFNKLSPTNEERDFMVAIPISWKDDFAAVIFVDMAYFDNVPVDYVLDRLRWFIGEYCGEITIERRYKPITQDTPTTTSTSEPAPNRMNLFDFSVEDEVEITIPERAQIQVPYNVLSEQLKFNRDDIQLIGHNILFDAKVFLSYDIKTVWHDDTLQMAFNLNPKVAKGSNKLKMITRRIWGIETPELSDLLGKGNEDKFKYITDKRVAVLYGGADADFTRMVYKYLEMLTPPKMLDTYRRQDIAMINEWIVQMDYVGMNTDYDNMVRDAEYLEKDLEKLRQFVYNYVGVVVDHRNKATEIYMRHQSGLINHEEYLRQVKEIKVNSNAIYRFEIGGNEVRQVLYEILDYPKVSFTKSGMPQVDKFAIKKLLNKKATTKHLISLPEDLKSSNPDNKEPLLEKDKFNGYAYPIAYVLSVYATLFKEYSSYYKPMIEQNLEGRIFKNTSLARIETRRIMNPGQTMKKNLKRNIIAHSDDYYLFDFDQSQVEYRIMVSISKFLLMIERLRDPEKDYHIESASNVYGIKAHTVTKDIRSGVKGISFGLPYGLGPHKLCGNLFNGEINKQNLYETRKLISKFEDTNGPVMDMLKKYRSMPLQSLKIKSTADFNSLTLPPGMDNDNALVKRLEFQKFMRKTGNELMLESGSNMPEETRKIIANRTLGEEFHRFIRPKLDEYDPNVEIGGVFGELGFYRLFDLSNMDMKKQGSIERPAGNFPIQNFAAELFRLILLRFAEELKKYGLRDKVIPHMLIHDEFLGSAHKDIHPFLLFKIIKEACVITLPGHTTYYVGINIGPNWEDCKKDTNEAPMLFVDRMIKRWDEGEFLNDHSYRDDVKGYVAKYKYQYFIDRIGEVVSEIQPDIRTKYIDYPHILENFENYTVRAYVSDYFKPNANLSSDELKKMAKNDPDRLYLLKFESWVIEHFGEGKEMKYPDGMIRKIIKTEAQIVDMVGALPELDFGDDEEKDALPGYDTDYWTFELDEDGGEEQAFTYFMPQEEFDEDEEFLKQFDFDNKEAKTVGQLLVKEKRAHKYLRLLNGQLIVELKMTRLVEEVKEHLIKYETNKEGYTVLFKTPTGTSIWSDVSKELDLNSLDEYIESLV